MLVNILDNAAKHGGQTVSISAMIEAHQVQIAFEDDGPGVAPDLLPHVFDRFIRTSDMGASPGVGLGLSICKGLIEAMGGTIVATSPIAYGRGTRITVLLPAGQLPPEQSDAIL